MSDSVSSTMMRAAVFDRYGPPEVLRIEQVPKPIPKDNEILIKIRATTVTPADWRMRSMIVPSPVFGLIARFMFGLTKPKHRTQGTELSGDVESVGKSVTRWKPGDAVIASTGANFGAHAEYICLPEDATLAAKPEALSYEEAAAISFGGLTSLYFLRDLSGLKEGEKVLINGASGGTGTYGVQIAKYLGAHVTGVCSGANEEMVRSLGADEVIDYTKEDFAQNGETYDIIYDTVGTTRWRKCKGSLKEGGCYALLVFGLTQVVQSVFASMVGSKRIKIGVTEESGENLEFLAELAGEEKLRAVIDKTYSLGEIVEAHRYVQQGHKKGNVIISVS